MALFAHETPDWAQIHIKELGNQLNGEVTKTTLVEAPSVSQRVSK